MNHKTIITDNKTIKNENQVKVISEHYNNPENLFLTKVEDSEKYEDQHQLNNKIQQKIISKKDKIGNILSKLQTKICQNLIEGKLRISQISRQIKPKHEKIQQEHPMTIHQKITYLNQELNSLRDSTLAQKLIEKNYNQQKKKQAVELIQRLKKDKQQHRKKVKSIQNNNRKRLSQESEVIVRLLRSQTEKKLLLKRQELAERVEGIMKRKEDRQNQIHRKYSSNFPKNKTFEETNNQKNSAPQSNQSHHHIPLENKKQKMIKFNQIQENQHILHYDKLMHKFILVPKGTQQWKKRENIKTPKKRPNLDQIPEKNHEQLHQFLKRSKPQNSLTPLIQKKSAKILANKYQKQLFPKVQQYGLKEQKKSDADIDVQETIQLKISYLQLSKNPKLKNLQQKWQRIYEDLLNKKIEKSKGLQLLKSIQKRLDKIDSGKIEERLRKKLQIFKSEGNMDDAKTISQEQINW